MKIDSGASYLLTNHAQPLNSASAVEKGPARVSSAASAGGIKQADFTSMTRQDMRDWMNSQIRSGQMTLDESAPLMAMTIKIPVGGSGMEVPADTDNQRIDFTEKALLGIEGALSSKDPAAAKRLQIALDILLKNQGQAIGVDTRV